MTVETLQLWQLLPLEPSSGGRGWGCSCCVGSDVVICNGRRRRVRSVHISFVVLIACYFGVFGPSWTRPSATRLAAGGSAFLSGPFGCVPMLRNRRVQPGPPGTSSATGRRSLLLDRPFVSLIASHALTAWGDRMWAFAIPLLFLEVFPQSLLLPALHAFVVQFVVFLLSPSIGSAVDRWPRLPIVRWSFCIANVCAGMSAAFLLVLLSTVRSADEDAVLRKPSFWSLFLPMLFFAVLSELGSVGSNLAVLKNWIVVMVDDSCSRHNAKHTSGRDEARDMELQGLVFATGGDEENFGEHETEGTEMNLTIGPTDELLPDEVPREAEPPVAAVQVAPVPNTAAVLLDPKDVLSRLNAIMRRVDLSCDVLAPLSFSIFLVYASSKTALAFVLLWNFASLPFEYGLLSMCYRAIPALADTPEGASGTSKKKHPLVVFVHGIYQYTRERVFLASFGYVCLYLTSLSPGVLMIAYLSASGVSPLAVAVFRGFSAASGIAGTFLYPWLSRRWGLVRSGFVTIWLFLLTVVIASLAVIVPFAIGTTFLAASWILMISVIMSRAFLWCFDLAETQIMQTEVDPSRRGLISGVEKCMCQLLSMLSFVPAMLFRDPGQFYALCSISVSSVFFGACCFAAFASRRRRVSTT